MIVGGIDTKDISVVIQGAVDLAVTPKCAMAVHKALPGAEIILSTWKGTPTLDIVADRIIYNQDPGGMQCSHGIDNVNRQITSTQNGVNQATKKYILKIRSDCFISSPRLLTYWNLYPHRSDSFFWFKHRIIMPTMYCKRFLDFHSKIPTPFHYSDWLQFGLSEDIRKIWNVDLVDPKKHIGFYSPDKYKGNKLQRTWLESRYTAEQYIFFSSVKKSFPQINYQGLSDYSSENMAQSEQMLFNNFILIEPSNLGFTIKKEPYQTIIKNEDAFRQSQPGCYYTEREFKETCENTTIL